MPEIKKRFTSDKKEKNKKKVKITKNKSRHRSSKRRRTVRPKVENLFQFIDNNNDVRFIHLPDLNAMSCRTLRINKIQAKSCKY